MSGPGLREGLRGWGSGRLRMCRSSPQVAPDAWGSPSVCPGILQEGRGGATGRRARDVEEGLCGSAIESLCSGSRHLPREDRHSAVLGKRRQARARDAVKGSGGHRVCKWGSQRGRAWRVASGQSWWPCSGSPAVSAFHSPTPTPVLPIPWDAPSPGTQVLGVPICWHSPPRIPHACPQGTNAQPGNSSARPDT